MEKEFRRLLESGASGLVLNDFLAVHEREYFRKLDSLISKMSEIVPQNKD